MRCLKHHQREVDELGNKIEWTDETWNPTVGCSRVSEGCRFCYAESVDRRFAATKGHEFRPWTGPNAAHNVRLHPERLDMPLKWRKPRRVFVNSMSDLFHEQVPDKFIWRVFQVMAQCGQHTFQILTKRPERMLEILQGRYWRNFGPSSLGGDLHALIIKGEHQTGDVPFLPNVWLGVSVENQQAADERIPLLLQTPAAVRFLSCEPLLGPVNLDRWFGLQDGNEWAECLCDEIDESDRPCITCECRKELGKKSGLDWVIAGGESGPNARPMHPDWARSLRDQCVAAGVPFFFKQWGEWVPYYHEAELDPLSEDKSQWIGDMPFRRVGKKKAGRLFDGRAWDEYPAVEAR